MNQQQRNYAIDRINQTKDGKIKSVKERFTSQEKKLSFEEKVALIRKGTVRLNGECRYNNSLTSCFDFSKYESDEKFDHAKAGPIMAAINDAARKAKDNIMLAGDTEALKAIEDFEKSVAKY